MNAEAGPFTEAAGKVILNRENMAYRLDGVFSDHEFAFTDLAGGTVKVEALTAAETWETVQAGVQEQQTVRPERPSVPAFRFTFTATGGAGKVHVRSRVRTDGH